MKIRILIKKKLGVLDVEGKAVQNALVSMKIDNVGEVIKGYFVEIDFLGDKKDVPKFVEEVCEELLVNDVIESFEYDIL